MAQGNKRKSPGTRPGPFFVLKNKKAPGFQPEPSRLCKPYHAVVRLITTPAIPVLQEVHDRMPLILKPGAYCPRLDPEKTTNPNRKK
jgi:putative SOS response-associated peptidase YedK